MSRRYPEKQHNSLTKSSSWRGAHWLLAYGKYGWPPYYSSKPKANEVWRFENSHCGGRAVSKHTQTKSVSPVLSFGQFLRKSNHATQTQRSPTWEHYKQHRHPYLRCLPCPRIFNSFAVISNNKLFHPGSRTLLAHIHKKFFFRGTWRLIKMAKWVLAEPTTDTVSAWDEVIPSCRITLVSDIPWNSDTWLSIDGFTCLINLLRTHCNLMKLSASNDIIMIFLGTVEEWNSKFPHFKTLPSLTYLYTNALKFYSLWLNFIKFTIHYGNYKEIRSRKENYGEFTYVLRHLTKHSWWIRRLSSASIVLPLYIFKRRSRVRCPERTFVFFHWWQKKSAVFHKII